MWKYEKKLEYPVKIKTPNPTAAKIIISQFGGPDGELGASMRYLSQRYTAPTPEVKAILNDIGTEELSHMEMVCSVIYQLTRDLTPKQIKESGFDVYFVDHTNGLYPVAASGTPFSANMFQSTGDPIADLTEDMAAEQKARLSYDNILRLVDDPDVRDVIKFLRQREIVHFQRFGDTNLTNLSGFWVKNYDENTRENTAGAKCPDGGFVPQKLRYFHFKYHSASSLYESLFLI